MVKQKEKYGCGLYALVNSQTFTKKETEILLSDEIKNKTKEGSTTYILNNILNKIDSQFYLTSLFVNYLDCLDKQTTIIVLEDLLLKISTALEKNKDASCPLFFLVKTNTQRKGTNHMICVEINKDTGYIEIIDSLKEEGIMIKSLQDIYNFYCKIDGVLCLSWKDDGAMLTKAKIK